jgi:hypothetical protein
MVRVKVARNGEKGPRFALPLNTGDGHEQLVFKAAQKLGEPDVDPRSVHIYLRDGCELEFGESPTTMKSTLHSEVNRLCPCHRRTLFPYWTRYSSQLSLLTRTC